MKAKKKVMNIPRVYNISSTSLSVKKIRINLLLEASVKYNLTNIILFLFLKHTYKIRKMD